MASVDNKLAAVIETDMTAFCLRVKAVFFYSANIYLLMNKQIDRFLK